MASAGEKRLEDAQICYDTHEFHFCKQDEEKKQKPCVSIETWWNVDDPHQQFCEAQEGVSGVLIGVIVGVACLAGLALLVLLVFLGVLVDLGWVQGPTLGS